MRRKKKNRIIYVPNNYIGVTEWIPPADKHMTDISTNSWYDCKVYENPVQTEDPIVFEIAPIIPEESLKQQLKTIKLRKQNKDPVFLACKKIRIYPTLSQRKILQKWFNAFADMFNLTIHYLRSKIKKRQLSFTKKGFKYLKIAKKIANFESVRQILYDQKKTIQDSMEINTIPSHILDEAIAQAVSNYKSCLTNFQNGNIRKFRIREWSQTRQRKIIKIESAFFRSGTFCPTTFPKMEASDDLSDIDRTVTLQYNSRTKKYIMFVPREIESKFIPKVAVDCGIDLGARSFATVYSHNFTMAIANDPFKKTKIDKYHKKIDKIHGLISLPPENTVEIVSHTIERDGRLIQKQKPIIVSKSQLKDKLNKSKLKKGLNKYHLKLKNLIRDMHYKVSYDLVHRFNRIFIGKFSTKGILSKNNMTISKATKRMIGVLSPYQFRQILKYMGHKYGCQVIEVDEYMTTKTCSNCGKINDIGGSKVYKCECGMTADRDENSAKDIMKKGIAIELGFDPDRFAKITIQQCEQRMIVIEV